MSRETCTKPFFNASDVTTIPRHRSTGKERWQNLNVTSARCRPNHDASGLPKHLDELSEPAYSCSVTMLLRYQVRPHRPFCPLFPNADWPRTSKSQLIVKVKNVEWDPSNLGNQHSRGSLPPPLRNLSRQRPRKRLKHFWRDCIDCTGSVIVHLRDPSWTTDRFIVQFVNRRCSVSRTAHFRHRKM